MDGIRRARPCRSSRSSSGAGSLRITNRFVPTLDLPGARGSLQVLVDDRAVPSMAAGAHRGVGQRARLGRRLRRRAIAWAAGRRGRRRPGTVDGWRLVRGGPLVTYGWLWTFLATTVVGPRIGNGCRSGSEPVEQAGWSLALGVAVAATAHGQRLSRVLVAMLAYGGLTVCASGRCFSGGLMLAAPALAVGGGPGRAVAAPRSRGEGLAGAAFVLAPGVVAAWLATSTSCIPPLRTRPLDRRAIDALTCRKGRAGS
jgi:hypothetical protein